MGGGGGVVGELHIQNVCYVFLVIALTCSATGLRGSLARGTTAPLRGEHPAAGLHTKMQRVSHIPHC